jgi:hypothetical protein
VLHVFNLAVGNARCDHCEHNLNNFLRIDTVIVPELLSIRAKKCSLWRSFTDLPVGSQPYVVKPADQHEELRAELGRLFLRPAGQG